VQKGAWQDRKGRLRRGVNSRREVRRQASRQGFCGRTRSGAALLPEGCSRGVRWSPPPIGSPLTRSRAGRNRARRAAGCNRATRMDLWSMRPVPGSGPAGAFWFAPSRRPTPLRRAVRRGPVSRLSASFSLLNRQAVS